MAVNRIKHSSVAPFANDRQLDRVQNLGVSGRLDSEDISEIGNLDIVEVVDNPPTVDITLDTNQYGSGKTLATLANKNFNWTNCTLHRASEDDVVVKAGDFYIDEMKYTITADVEKAIAVGALTANQKRIDVVSLDPTGGNDAAKVVVTAGTGTSSALDEDDVPATPAGNLKIGEVQVQANAAADGIVPLVDMAVVSRSDEAELHLKEFEFAKIDLVVPVKERGDNTDVIYPISRTMYVEDAFVNRYDASFSVNGLSTENFSLESDNKTWFLGDASNIVVDRFAAASVGPFTLTYVPFQRLNGNYVIKARKYNADTGEYTDLVEDSAEADGFSVGGLPLSESPGGDEVTLVTALTADEVLIVRYAGTDVPEAEQQFFKRVPSEVDAHPVIAGGLKHGQVEVYLSDDANNFVLRLQSVTISTSLTREALYEIGHLRAYDRPMTFPIPITVNIEATASDLQEFARFCGKLNEYKAGEVTELAITDFIKNLDLTVKIYRENDEVRAKSPWVGTRPLKEITVENLTMTDENTEVRVNQNGTQTWGMKANTQLYMSSWI
jgi:hypothetical protein